MVFVTDDPNLNFTNSPTEKRHLYPHLMFIHKMSTDNKLPDQKDLGHSRLDTLTTPRSETTLCPV